MALIRDAVIQSRDLDLFYKTYAEAPPIPTDEDVVDAVASASATLSGYTRKQATDNGIGFSTQQDKTPVYIDQRADRLYSIDGARTVQVTAQLAEMTPQNQELATGMGGEVETVAPTPTAYGHDRYIVGAPAGPQYSTLLVSAKQPFSRLPFWTFVPCGVREGSLNYTISPTQKGIAALTATATLDESYDPEDFDDIEDFGGILFVTNRTLPMSA